MRSFIGEMKENTKKESALPIISPISVDLSTNYAFGFRL